MGFTFNSQSQEGTHTMYFKTSAAGFARAPEWHSYRVVKTGVCLASEKQSYTVNIIRESPLIAQIDDFASEEDCEHMYTVAGPEMGPAHVGGAGSAGASSYRRSFSSNMNPDLDDPSDLLTQLAQRQFSFVRHITGYGVTAPGQEPVNAVLYKVTRAECWRAAWQRLGGF